MRVAALADVHGNAPALAAVLEDVECERPDLVVFCGDLTWGSLPQQTLELVRAMAIPARFVRGNADRMVGVETEGRGPWMTQQHTPEDLAFLAGFEPTVDVDVDGLAQRASVTARRAPTRSASPSGHRWSGFASSRPASMRASLSPATST
jgi:3',5'-cyclic AMP phosphodiesterase CpdA